MDKKNLRPQPAQPVHRSTTGQLPPELAELSEELLQLQGDALGASVLPATGCTGTGWSGCSFDGDDTE